MSEIIITLPSLHEGQKEVWGKRSRFNALCCGRRWGKTKMAIAIAGEHAVRGENIGIFAPDYKIMSETYRELEESLEGATEHSNKTDGLIRLIGGGRLDFWTLNNPRAGRSRNYHGVIVDEAAFAGKDMADVWNKSISPTLLDHAGWAWVMSTPNGSDPDNWFYQVCHDGGKTWRMFHAASSTNPYLPAEEFDRLRETNDPLVFQQEYLAEFVDWNGAAFFRESSLLEDGKPVPYPERCDMVFAVIDTALKDQVEHDGTAVTYYARNAYWGTPLTILDYDVLQIEGSLLEAWLPNVIQRLDDLAKICQARHGSYGAWIEDKASGIVLLQQAQRKGLPVRAISSDLTAMGKEGRALSVSGYVYQGMVRISEHAYSKQVTYKGRTLNHLLHQVCQFRMGQKEGPRDLLDTFCYGVAISLGDAKGH